MKRQVFFEGEGITYEVLHKNVKNVNIHVKSDLSVWVSASKKVSERQLDSLVLEKAPWILKALADMRERSQNQLRNRYHDGGQVAFLGKMLPLNVQRGGAAGFMLTEQGLLLSGCADEAAIRAQVERFYHEMCILVFEEINVRVYQAYFAKQGIVKAQLAVRKMSASWGRCHINKGLIVLNRQLNKAAPSCITSVLVHEYVHFLYPDHGKGFYELLRGLLPQYDELTRQLTQQVACRPED